MPTPLPLPSPSLVRRCLAGGDFAADCIALAESILAHRIPILGRTIQAGPSIEWRRDYLNGAVTGVEWFKRIPFLDFSAAGDHKVVWELNRHQHLVVLAQAFVLTNERRFLAEIEDELESWAVQNPFVRSINWASALELAFRSLSWLWVLHLAGPDLSESIRNRLGSWLIQHATVVEHNLSTYFAPNTHILGEGVALHAIGLAVRSERWRLGGLRIVDREVARQVQSDGFHFEQSSYYHLYALDMLLFHYLLAGRPDGYAQTLKRMARCLSTLLDSSGTFPLIGDDDGGRFFYPYGERRGFARASLATCAALFPAEEFQARSQDLAQQAIWWFGEAAIPDHEGDDQCEHFSSCGLTVFRRAGAHLTFDCGPFSTGSAGHSHADTLALTLRRQGRDVLIDPGTYTYVADPAERNWFRGTASHSTISIDERDQADPVKPFRWEHKPTVRRLETELWKAAGECSFRGATHRRWVDFTDPKRIIVWDEVAGSANRIDQNWHCAEAITTESDGVFRTGSAYIEIDPQVKPEIVAAHRSQVFGSREPSWILRCRRESLPVGRLRTTIHLDRPA